MLHGRVVRPPRYGSKLDSVDDAAAKAMPGVVAVVRDGSFLGVVAAREEQAIAARAALIKSAKWTLGPPLPDPAKIHEFLLSLPTEDNVISEKHAPALASTPSGAQVSTQILEATYRRPYMSHASIGPSCSLAEFKDGKLTVWTHSQGVFPNRAKVAEALGMNVADVRRKSIPKARAATATTAPTMSRSMRRCSPAPCRGDPCGCSGCATTSSAGSPTAPPW